MCLLINCKVGGIINDFEKNLLRTLEEINESLKDIANVKRRLYLLKITPPKYKKKKAFDFSAKEPLEGIE